MAECPFWVDQCPVWINGCKKQGFKIERNVLEDRVLLGGGFKGKEFILFPALGCPQK
jgi:hypothetical protein